MEGTIERSDTIMVTLTQRGRTLLRERYAARFGLSLEEAEQDVRVLFERREVCLMQFGQLQAYVPEWADEDAPVIEGNVLSASPIQVTLLSSL